MRMLFWNATYPNMLMTLVCLFCLTTVFSFLSQFLVFNIGMVLSECAAMSDLENTPHGDFQAASSSPVSTQRLHSLEDQNLLEYYTALPSNPALLPNVPVKLGNTYTDKIFTHLLNTITGNGINLFVLGIFLNGMAKYKSNMAHNLMIALACFMWLQPAILSKPLNLIFG